TRTAVVPIGYGFGPWTAKMFAIQSGLQLGLSFSCQPAYDPSPTPHFGQKVVAVSVGPRTSRCRPQPKEWIVGGAVQRTSGDAAGATRRGVNPGVRSMGGALLPGGHGVVDAEGRVRRHD